MLINIGKIIRELRRRDGRTQEMLASALGVTSQAVSCWESGGSYPDMELLPSIANYFGVSIDELFGYENDRDRKADALVGRIYELDRQNNGVDVCVDECVSLAREGLAEFPGNEKLTLCLASMLYNAGYVRRGEHHLTDSDGYDIFDTELHRTYPEWQEAIKLYESLTNSAVPAIRSRAAVELSQLYLNVGEHEKTAALAESAPEYTNCRELLRMMSRDGVERAEVLGENLLLWIQTAAQFMVDGVILNKSVLNARESAEILQNAAELFDCICTDHDYGRLNILICQIYLYESEFLWLDDRRDEAFDALDKALFHATEYERVCADDTVCHTSPLLRRLKLNSERQEVNVTKYLPDDWPWWQVPDYTNVKAEIMSDPRWNEWVKKTQK